MNKEIKNRFLGTLIVPIGLAIVLLPFSMLIGWNLINMILFWFLIIPGLTFLLPTIFSKSSDHLFESILGLVIFYGIMVFLIYDHYQTDYFRIMIASFVINLILTLIISRIKRKIIQTQ